MNDAEAAGQVLPFPSQEVDPYRGLAPHLEVASARARALHALASRTAHVVVASARALPPRLSDPGRLAASGVILRPGLEIAPQELGTRLAIAGFNPEDPVDEHGEFCVRGGVVDFYPTSETQPVRLEFIGDIIESVRRYDASTQRSLTALDHVSISPQRELLGDPNAPDEPGRFDRSSSIVDYVRLADASLVLFEIDDIESRGRTLEEQWRASAVDMEARGRTVLPFEQMAATWDDLGRWLSTGRRISQLALEEEDGGAHVPALPSLEYRGRINDWVEEIRKARDRGEITVFVAATPGRAERTLELLADYDVRARDVNASDDLAKAAVLVTIGAAVEGLPSAWRRVCRSSARPTCSRKSGASTSAGARPPAPSSRIFAI